MGDQAVADDVRAAADGDDTAWCRLVERFSGLVWSVARAYGLGPADAADVSQTTWLRLAEHVHRVREPDRLGSWLATTARNESMGTLRRRARLVPAEFDFDLMEDETTSRVEANLLAEERDASLWRAFRSLPAQCQSLLRVLMADPRPSYAEVSDALGIPQGSIGPRRARCLERLRSRAEMREAVATSAVEAGS
ncbi:MAG TPA: sigma-70 family RNA polymerase sigma factor [Acidimicrobiales bacterium]|nr:sigma-70 family RNA polymerase sigma factor [Acidimicrobiales bacterium]